MLLRAETADDDCSDVMKDDMTHTIIEDSVGHDDKDAGLLVVGRYDMQQFISFRLKITGSR